MPNNTLRQIIDSREDLSDYVFHFTKGENAKETLFKILNEHSIKDIRNTGYICFTEAPLLALPNMFDIFARYKSPMFAPFGIGINKKDFYQMGGRPVIYGDSHDYQLLPKQLLWRFEMLIPEQKDFSWLREWRLQEKQFNIEFKNCFIITKTNVDRDELQSHFTDIDVDVDGEPADGGCEQIITVQYTKEFKFISLEDLMERCKHNNSKTELNNALSEEQEIEGLTGYSWH